MSDVIKPEILFDLISHHLPEGSAPISSSPAVWQPPIIIAIALANLLSHPTLRPDILIKKEEEGRAIMRSAKDLGRVLALAWLVDAGTLRDWSRSWRTALSHRFPEEHVALARRAGNGLRALLVDPDALDQAKHSIVTGLLRGHELTTDNLRIIGDQLLELAIDPLDRE